MSQRKTPGLLNEVHNATLEEVRRWAAARAGDLEGDYARLFP